MATPAERKGTSPRIKFRWCRSLPLRAKQIHLVLTSLTGTRIPLEWKTELGWYESALVSLSCGLHSGFLLITKKVRPSFFHFGSSSDAATLDECEYKIDPFFVTAHKYSIELFLQTDRDVEVLQDFPLLKDRYLSSPHLQTRPEGKLGEAEPLSASSIRWRSYQELPRRKSVCWQTEDTEDFEVKSQCLDNEHPPQLHKKWTEGENVEYRRSSHERISGPARLLKGTNEDPLLPAFGKTLRKWDSFCEKGDPSHNKTKADVFFPSKLALQTEVERSRSQNETIQTIFSQGEERGAGSSSQSRLVKSITHTDSQFFDQLESDTLARVHEVESLLRQSDEEVEWHSSDAQLNLYFKEVTPPKNEGGFGCLITFESRSTSMDDLGSPRALEDVLVSLTSSDTDPKPYPSLSLCGTGTYIAETQKTNVPLSDRTKKCEKNSRGWKASPKEHKYPDSDITINEDENFQYDSLKNEDQKIPLNIKGVLDSEDSSDYSSSNVDSNPPFHIYVHKDNDQSKEVDSSCESEILPQEPNSDDCSSGRRESYNLLKQKNSPSSAKGSIPTDPLVLVHPGSLRSETVIESSRTLIESKKSSGTLNENFTSLRLPSKPETKVSNIKESLLRTEELLPVPSSCYPVRSAKGQEKKAISKKVRKSSSLSKTILIIRDKKNPNMNSTGTQTTLRDSPVLRSSRLPANRSLPSSFAAQYKDRGMYSPLPNKVNGPWTSKLGYEKTNNYPFCENSTIKKMQKNLYNLAQADQILSKIHPFDYHPTLIHGDTSAHISFPRTPGIRERGAFRSTPSSPLRVTQSAPRLYYSSAPVTGPLSKSFFASDACQHSYSSQHKNDPEISPYSRIKRVPKPHFSIYGRNFLDSSADKSSRLLGTGVLSQRLLNYHHSNSLLDRSPSDTITLRPTASLPDLRGPRGEHTRFSRSRLSNVGQRTTGAYSSPPAFTRDYDLKSIPLAKLRGSRWRRSFDDRLPLGDETSISTDSLIEEAENVTKSYLRSPRFHNITRGLIPRRQPPEPEYSRLSRDVDRSWTLPSYEAAENSVADCLRARSETDLRMVGTLTGGHRGKPPYLPYSRDELTLGQIVKVLVPGEGVALARVIYNPPLDNLSSGVSSSDDQNITVVLLSEPTNLSGSVITIPLNKFLLAWPKG